MNFGEHFRSIAKRPQIRLDRMKCIYCPMKAEVGCHSCGAPMCKKCAELMGKKFYSCKNSVHKKAIEVAVLAELTAEMEARID